MNYLSTAEYNLAGGVCRPFSRFASRCFSEVPATLGVGRKYSVSHGGGLKCRGVVSIAKVMWLDSECASRAQALKHVGGEGWLVLPMVWHGRTVKSGYVGYVCAATAGDDVQG